MVPHFLLECEVMKKKAPAPIVAAAPPAIDADKDKKLREMQEFQLMLDRMVKRGVIV